jgi:hypothetical protein
VIRQQAIPATRDRRIVLAVVAGLASGALSAFLFDLDEQRFAAVAPGLTFGIVFGSALVLLHLARVWQAVLFAAASELSWYLAYLFSLSLFEWIGNTLREAEGKMVVIGFAAGMLGAVLLGGATAGLFPWLRSWRRHLAIAMAGGAAGLLLGLDWGKGYPLFIAWQGAFALCLALAFPARPEKSVA